MASLGYSDSFKALGYELVMPRTHWSSANEKGVCLSLWLGEMDQNNLWKMDSKVDCGPIESWNAVGKNLRRKHLITAWDVFERWVDVVVRQGSSWEEGVPSFPWVPENRKNHKFRLQSIERDTGHFSIKLEEIEKEKQA